MTAPVQAGKAAKVRLTYTMIRLYCCKYHGDKCPGRAREQKKGCLHLPRRRRGLTETQVLDLAFPAKGSGAEKGAASPGRCDGLRSRSELCPECLDLFLYAAARTAACRQTENVRFCQQCPVHCYRPDERKKIRAVMRYAGPQMLFYAPGELVRHLLSSTRAALGRLVSRRKQGKCRTEKSEKKMKLKKILLVILGCLGLAVGAIGAVVPLLPSFPFLLLALVCFAKASERLHDWFVQTRIYKNNLESFVKGEGMTKRTKIRLVITVTLLMGFGFFMMLRKKLYLPCGILAAVWLGHVIYFVFRVKGKN